MENWRSYKFFDGWIMKKIEHTYNFNFKNKYRRNQPVSECKYTYCCDSLDNSLSLCEETSFYSSETPSMRKDRRKLRRKKLVKKMKRNEDRYNRYTSSDSEEEYLRRRRQKYQRIFIHQKIIYDEYVTKKDRKFYPTRLKMLSHERWNEELLKKKEREEKMDAHDRDDKEEKNEGKNKKDKEEQPRVDKDEKESEVKEESTRPYPPLQLAQPPLPPPLPPPPPPPLPPLPPPPAVRLLAVNSTGYLPVQQVTAAPRPDTQYNDQLPYGTIAGIAYEIPVDITYIIGCNAMFRQF